MRENHFVSYEGFVLDVNQSYKFMKIFLWIRVCFYVSHFNDFSLTMLFFLVKKSKYNVFKSVNGCIIYIK